jgi:signal transduction histidine kinase/ActR/RegA family two-component response regulator
MTGNVTNYKEYRVIRDDGALAYIKVHGVIQTDAEGQLANIVGVVQEITQEKQAEQALRASRDQLSIANSALEKAARMKDEFLASMSHELRTPLTGILGLSEGLQEEVYGALNDHQRRAVFNIETSGRHLLELINDILDVSKLEAGMLELQLETCILAQVCQASLQLVKGMAQKKSQKISFAMMPQNIIFLADSRRFKQVIVNLLSNAVKYTPVGGSLGLEVEGNEQERTIQISVWDEGIGIKTEDLDRLFQPFVQIDSSLSREQTGTGLGLTLVQHLVELHGGSINVQSTYGEGSRFTISLPWVSPPSALDDSSPAGESVLRQSSQLAVERDGSRTAAPAVPVSPPANAPLVMVMDDNETNRTTLIDFLSAKQFRVAAAADAAEFFDQLTHVLPDLVLMDIQMPGMDGMEAIRRVRTHPNARIARVPIIALTALAMPGDRERCITAGANDYLSKPIRLKDLATLVHTMLSKPANPKS